MLLAFISLIRFVCPVLIRTQKARQGQMQLSGSNCSDHFIALKYDFPEDNYWVTQIQKI